MARLLRHRQTKETETDTPSLTSTAPHSYSTIHPELTGQNFEIGEEAEQPIKLERLHGTSSHLRQYGKA
jgi:hypothetical protein